MRPASFEQGIGGLADCKRPGRPWTFPDVVAAEVKAIACELPALRGVPISRWSLTELRAKIIGCGLVEAVSTTTLGRWLAEAALRPWRGTARGSFHAIPTLPPRPAGSLTCTSAPFRARACEVTTM